MRPSPLVSIIVITVDTPRMTAACLRSVIRNSSVPYELIVVNNSQSRPIRKMLQRFPQARVIQNRENRGFSRAANQGIRAGRGRYFCLLNTDTLVPPGWLERLVEAAQRPGVGAVGPASDETYDRMEGKPWPFPFSADTQENTDRVDRIFQRRYRNKLESVPFLHGFCFLISRLTLADNGWFDERYFFGLEDIDYSLLLRIRGYQLLKVHSLFVHHRQRASSSPTRRQRLVELAEHHFVDKWTTPLSRPGIDFPTLIRQLNQQVPVRRKILPVEPLSFPIPLRRPVVRRLMRAGFRIQTPTRPFLARFRDLSIFPCAPSTDRTWKALQGGLDPARLSQKSRSVRQELERMTECGLAREIRPQPTDRCRVTVMMIAYQARRWIDQAIESVLAQQFQDFELIVADDRSLDGTQNLIQRYAWHPKIRSLYLPCHAGIAAARNRILQEARGKYIAVCDADDILLPQSLQRMVETLEKNPKAGWVYADRLGIHSGGLPEKEYPARRPDGKREFRFNVIAHAGALIRREAMEEAGGYDESLLSTEDYDLALKIARRWKILALGGETHCLWRQHWESASRINPWARIETTRLLETAKRRNSNLHHPSPAQIR